MLGIIQENPYVARAFADSIGTTLPVLSDWTAEVASEYGVYDASRHLVKRTTFTIDADGVIRSILQDKDSINVDPGLDACRILQPVQSTTDD